MEIKINANLDLVLTLPAKPGKREHSVFIPVSLEGLRVLKQILIADKRERETGGTPSFATEACPTQQMVTEYLRHHAPKVPVKIVTQKRTAIELDLTDLDLKF